MSKLDDTIYKITFTHCGEYKKGEISKMLVNISGNTPDETIIPLVIQGLMIIWEELRPGDPIENLLDFIRDGRAGSLVSRADTMEH